VPTVTKTVEYNRGKLPAVAGRRHQSAFEYTKAHRRRHFVLM
jgi:hypothetical protein